MSLRPRVAYPPHAEQKSDFAMEHTRSPQSSAAGTLRFIQVRTEGLSDAW